MVTRLVHQLTLPFVARGAAGSVEVTVSANDDPAGVGADLSALGFPFCQATVSTELAGYNSLFGWVQLVGTKSAAEASRRFAADPLQIFEDLNCPFGFYGVHPTLFDAPSRRDRQQTLDWLAHSFLCLSPGGVMERAVQPVAAFQWGFRLLSGSIEIDPPSELDLAEWEIHRDLLVAGHPGWRFDIAP